MAGTRRPARESAPSRHGSGVEDWAAHRQVYVDNLKVLLIAGIIAGHAIAGYSDQDFWPYAEMNEVALSSVTQTLLYAVVAPATLLMIPLLFLVAGLLTPRSMDRKGPGPFAQGPAAAARCSVRGVRPAAAAAADVPGAPAR